MTESEQAKSNKPMFVITSRRRVFVELLLSRERGVRLVWSVTQEHVRNTRRGGEFRSDRDGHIDERALPTLAKLRLAKTFYQVWPNQVWPNQLFVFKVLAVRAVPVGACGAVRVRVGAVRVGPRRVGPRREGGGANPDT